MNVAIVIPFRDRGDVNRRANLHHVVKHLTAARIGDVLIVSDGRPDTTPFNRSRAYNRGVAMQHGPGVVYVFHEADMLVPPEQLRKAIHWAADKPGLVVPFDTYRYLSAADSAAVLTTDADPGMFEPERVMVDGRAVGAVNVVSWETMTAAGRWDESFEGWGFDDRAMAAAFGISTGRSTRFVKGPGHHLWHEPGWSASSRFAGGSRAITAREQRVTAANRNRLHSYLRAVTPEQVRELTSGEA